MNVEDFKDLEIPEGDPLEIIFAHQRDLADRYHEIEEKNLGHPIPSSPYKHWKFAGPLDIQDRASQLRIKNFCWRVTEEITEATCAMDEENKTHFEEELIDALHFLTELMCLCGVELNELCFNPIPSKYSTSRTIRYYAYSVVERLGEMANTLKLKEWKTSAMITDVTNFRRLAIDSFQSMVVLLGVCSFDSRSALAMYLRKHQVNSFRQRTAY